MSPNGSYQGSTFREVRDQIFSDPYQKLPTVTRTLGDFYKGIRNLLLEASRKRMDDPSDIAPYFEKLLHPNGIALTGTWTITQSSPYTGYFGHGAQGLIIVRCSILRYKPLQGQYRGFGFAGKIFPTMDPDKRVKTGNFVCIDVLSGTKAKHFTDVALTNAPKIGGNLDTLMAFGPISAGTGDFIRADLQPFVRPVYPVAELGTQPGASVVSPRWMMIKADPSSGQADRMDFRDELRVENYPNHTLKFNISAASSKPFWRQPRWQYLGDITLTESVTSESCDHRLVFKHARLK